MARGVWIGPVGRIPRQFRGHVIGIAAFLVVYAALLNGITLGQLFAFGDFPPYHGARAIDKFARTWHFDQLGFPYIYSALPLYLGVVTTLGGALGQNLLYLALIPAGFLSFLVFVGRFLERLPPRYLAAGVYAINPVTIGEFVNGGIAALIGFAGLPLVIHYLYEVVETDRWSAAAKAGVVFGATTISPWLGFWMVGPFATSLAVRVRSSRPRLVKLLSAGGLGVLLALPSVHHVVQRARSIESQETLLGATMRWNFEYADDLLAVSRLAGNHGMRAMNELGYNTDPGMIIGLVIPGVGLFAWRRDDVAPYFTIATAIIGFLVLTGLGLTDVLFETIPILWSVRNPVKLQYPLLLSLCVLFGAGLDALMTLGDRSRPGTSAWARQRTFHRPAPPKVLSIAILAIVSVSVLAYAMPAAGAFGLQPVRGDEYYVEPGYHAVGAELDGRILWLPYGYTTQLRLRDAYPDHVGVKSGGVLHGIPNTDYVGGLFGDIAAGRPVHDRLADLGVRYVVVETDPPGAYGAGPPRAVHRWGAPWALGNPSEFANRFESSPGYTAVGRRGEFRIFRVDGVEDPGRAVRRTGLHAVVTPTEPTVDRVGENLVENPDFRAGLGGWWVPPDSTGRSTRVVQVDGSPRAELVVNATAKRLPLAQEIATQPQHPYQIRVTATGEGTVSLVWYDGPKAPENLVQRRTWPLDATPIPVQAGGSTLSIRIRPNASSQVRVDTVGVYPSTMPPATGSAGAAGIPGVTLSGATEVPPAATIVAVNTDQATADRIGAEVRIVDAETVLGGPYVFDSGFRQGTAVRIEPGDRPETIPAGARAVTVDSRGGRIVDYWIIGTFDDTPVTVFRTSFDERWAGTPNTPHFRANGWANGFVDIEREQIRWRGGAFSRAIVIGIWLLAWGAVIGAFLVPPAWEQLEDWRRTRHPRTPLDRR